MGRITYENIRVSNKHDTEENWNKSNIIPLKAELIIYDPDENHDYYRIKFGDGETTPVNLPFFGGGVQTENDGEIFNDYENNKALSEYSSASGYNTSAGGKAFIIKRAEVVPINTEKEVTLEIPVSMLKGNQSLRLRIQFEEEVKAGTKFAIYNGKKEDNSSLFIEKCENFFNFNNSSGNDRYDCSRSTIIDIKDKTELRGWIFSAKKNNASASNGGINSNEITISDFIKDDKFVANFYIINYGQQELTISLGLHKIGDWTLWNGMNVNTKLPITSGNKFTISNIANIEKGDVWSLYSSQDGIGTNFDFYGIVTNTSSEDNTITIDKVIDKLVPLQEGKNNQIWFPYKPHLGDESIGEGSQSEGYMTIAVPYGAHAEGYESIAGGKYSHAEGLGTKAGWASHSEGNCTEAIGIASHAQGSHNKATGRQADANGLETMASGGNATSNGYRTTASGSNSDAGGYGTTASGDISFTRGLLTQATNKRAFAIGNETIANGEDSFAAGWKTKATRWTQAVVGKANKEDADALFIVGNGSDGTAEKRSNAFTVKNNGTATIQNIGYEDNNVVNYRQLQDYLKSTPFLTKQVKIVLNDGGTFTLEKIHPIKNSVAIIAKKQQIKINKINLIDFKNFQLVDNDSTTKEEIHFTNNGLFYKANFGIKMDMGQVKDFKNKTFVFSYKGLMANYAGFKIAVRKPDGTTEYINKTSNRLGDYVYYIIDDKTFENYEDENTWTLLIYSGLNPNFPAEFMELYDIQLQIATIGEDGKIIYKTQYYQYFENNYLELPNKQNNEATYKGIIKCSGNLELYTDDDITCLYYQDLSQDLIDLLNSKKEG